MVSVIPTDIILGKPILCLFDDSGTARLSAMLSGNPAMQVIHYREIAEANAAIDAFIADQSA